MKSKVVDKIRLFFRCYKETCKLYEQLRKVEMAEKILTGFKHKNLSAYRYGRHYSRFGRMRFDRKLE